MLLDEVIELVTDVAGAFHEVLRDGDFPGFGRLPSQEGDDILTDDLVLQEVLSDLLAVDDGVEDILDPLSEVSYLCVDHIYPLLMHP